MMNVMWDIRKVYSICILMLFCLFASACSPQDPKYTDIPKLEEKKTTVIFMPTSTSTVFPTKIKITSAITPTKTVTPSSSNTPTSTAESFIISSRYLVIEDIEHSIFLVDILNGNTRNLGSKDIEPIKIISFVNNGCELIAILSNGSIIQINLHGQIIREILPPNWYHGFGTVSKKMTNSPTKKFLAYLVGYGNQGYSSFEKQEIEVINLTDHTVFQLTDRGGAWESDWSPNGDWIAFSDFDANNINQLYIAKENGTEKIKLSSFNDVNIRILHLQWSPDGNKIAFQLYNTQDRTTTLGLLSIEGLEGHTKLFPDVPSNVLNFWWDDEETLVIHTKPDSNASTQAVDGILWLNTRTNKIIDRLNAVDTPDQIIISTNNYDHKKVGFFSDRNFFIYDAATRKFENLFENYFDYSNWLIAPPEFRGEQSCKTQ